MKNLILNDGYEFSFEKELIHSELYECTGYILKDGELLDNFNGIGLFDTYEDVKIELFRYLIDIEKIQITKDNIHLYYEFMGSVVKSDYHEVLSKLFDDRFKNVCFNLVSNVQQLQNNAKYEMSTTLGGSLTIGQSFFGVEDTLKPIDEYIEEIKASNEYKEYKKSIFLKQGKSKAVSNVLKLLDKDYSYKVAFEDTLGLFDVTREDLELELEIYI